MRCEKSPNYLCVWKSGYKTDNFMIPLFQDKSWNSGKYHMYEWSLKYTLQNQLNEGTVRCIEESWNACPFGIRALHPLDTSMCSSAKDFNQTSVFWVFMGAYLCRQDRWLHCIYDASPILSTFHHTQNLNSLISYLSILLFNPQQGSLAVHKLQSVKGLMTSEKLSENSRNLEN